MLRRILVTALLGAMSATVPALAQELPELDGAPPPLRIPKDAPKPAPKAPAPKPAAPKPVAPQPVVVAKPPAVDPALKAERDRLTQQAEAQKAEATRLASLSADLDLQRKRLDTREADLARKETAFARKAAELDRQTAELEQQSAALAATPAPAAPPPAPRYAISYEDARRACTRAAISEALDRDFQTARYDLEPHFYETQLELRGRIRMEDRRGWILVNTVCKLDSDGDVVDFNVLR